MSVITVTTTTVVVATTSLGITAALSVIGTWILIFALIAKELSSAYENEVYNPLVKERLKSLTGSLAITIVPMLIIFALIVAVKVMEILSP